MSLIEGIGDEVTEFFIIVFALLFVFIAWWSTNISEQRHYRTVLLLDQRRLRGRSIFQVRRPRQLSNHTEAVTITEGTSTTSTSTTGVEEHSSDATSNPPETLTVQPKPNEVATSSNQSETTEDTSIESLEVLESTTNTENLENISEFEEREIIETMDADTQNSVRLRRLAHFESATTSRNNDTGTNNAQREENHLPHSTDKSDSSAEIVDNNEKLSKAFLSNNPETVESEKDNSSKMTIKLKYINDDVRIVDGQPDEYLGDFKLRHFSTELNSNKIVRLIFNGQVLKQDRQTLQHCGLFNNCVVHCLIHQKRPSIGESQPVREGENSNSELFRDNPFVEVTNINNNNQGIDWDLGNFLFASISFILLAAWYFRYVYAHLYTVTATIGLLVITGIFSIILIGTYFPDNDQLLNPHARIRIARA